MKLLRPCGKCDTQTFQDFTVKYPCKIYICVDCGTEEKVYANGRAKVND